MTDVPETHSSETAAAPAPPLPLAPRPRFAEVLSQDVTPQVDGHAKQMIAGGDAMLVKNSRNAVHGFVLDGDHFDTRLEWTATELNAICACETRAAGFVCSHIWATVLLAERSGAFRSLEESHTHPLFNRGVEAVIPQGSNARRSPNAWPARPGWKIHLASVAQASNIRANHATSGAAGLPRQVLYIVDVAETKEAGSSAIIIELQSRHQKKSRFRGGNGNGGGGGVGLRARPFASIPMKLILSRIALTGTFSLA